MEDLSSIVSEVPEAIWAAVRKTRADMSWRTWWHVKWYEDPIDAPDGYRPQKVRGTNIDEKPYERCLFFESAKGRWAPAGSKVAYFGSDHPTATCETMLQFRELANLDTETVRAYFAGEFDPNEEGYGYPLEFNIDESATFVDLRHPSNRLFEYFASVGPWENGRAFANEVSQAEHEDARLQTQVIARAAFERGYNGIWYTSVRTPPGTFVSSGECLVLFEGAEDLVRHWQPEPGSWDRLTGRIWTPSSRANVDQRR